MSEVYADVDALLTELGVIKKDAPTIKAFGKVWTLRQEIPSTVGLQILRATAADDKTVLETVEENLGLMRNLFDPPEQVDELAAVAGFNSLSVVLQVAIAAMSGEDAASVTTRITSGDPEDTDTEKKG